MVTLGDLDSKLSALTRTYRFVAVTPGDDPGVLGSAGWKGMNDDCISHFGAAYPSVRMCTTEELLSTPVADWPTLTVGGVGWYRVHPVIAAANSNHWVDISGLSRADPADLSCAGWTAGSPRLSICLHETGEWRWGSCDASIGVTCCAPEDEIP